MIKVSKEGLLFSILFVVGAAGVITYRISQVEKLNEIPFRPQALSFKLEPPSSALSGNISKVYGVVKKQSREAKDFGRVGKDEKVIQGEVLATEKKSSAQVEFQNLLKVSLDSNSEVAFIDLVPSEFLLKQGSGVVVYDLSDHTQSISVRHGYMLFTLYQGLGRISIEESNDRTVVEIISGEAKIAMVDLENNTQVWGLTKGQKVLVDNGRRLVVFLN